MDSCVLAEQNSQLMYRKKKKSYAVDEMMTKKAKIGQMKRTAAGMRKLTWFLPTSCGSACWEKKAVTTTKAALSQSDQINRTLASRLIRVKHFNSSCKPYKQEQSKYI